MFQTIFRKINIIYGKSMCTKIKYCCYIFEATIEKDTWFYRAVIDTQVFAKLEYDFGRFRAKNCRTLRLFKKSISTPRRFPSSSLNVSKIRHAQLTLRSFHTDQSATMVKRDCSFQNRLQQYIGMYRRCFPIVTWFVFRLPGKNRERRNSVICFYLF